MQANDTNTKLLKISPSRYNENEKSACPSAVSGALTSEKPFGSLLIAIRKPCQQSPPTGMYVRATYTEIAPAGASQITDRYMHVHVHVLSPPIPRASRARTSHRPARSEEVVSSQ